MIIFYQFLVGTVVTLLAGMILVYYTFRIKIEPDIEKCSLLDNGNIDHLGLLQATESLELLGFQHEGDYRISLMDNMTTWIRVFIGPDRFVLGCVAYVNPHGKKGYSMCELVTRFDDGEEISSKNQYVSDSFKYPHYRHLKRYPGRKIPQLLETHRQRIKKFVNKTPLTYSETMVYTLRQSLQKELSAQVDFGLLTTDSNGLHYRCTPYGAIYMTLKQITATLGLG